MNFRSCPHCNYKYSIPEYRNLIYSQIRFLEWNCKNCGKKFTFNFKRRFIIAIPIVSILVILMILKGADLISPLVFAILLAGHIFGSYYCVVNFDEFKKAE